MLDLEMDPRANGIILSHIHVLKVSNLEGELETNRQMLIVQTFKVTMRNLTVNSMTTLQSSGWWRNELSVYVDFEIWGWAIAKLRSVHFKMYWNVFSYGWLIHRLFLICTHTDYMSMVFLLYEYACAYWILHPERKSSHIGNIWMVSLLNVF